MTKFYKNKTPCLLLKAGAMTPVPLPYHTSDFRGEPMTVVSFENPRLFGGDGMNGYIHTSDGGRFYPSVADLVIVSEGEYMDLQAEHQVEPPSAKPRATLSIRGAK